MLLRPPAFGRMRGTNRARGMGLDTLVELLENSSKTFGANPALLIKPSFRYLVWSYADLWDDSGRVASFLQDQGVKKGDRILLWGPNMPQWVLGFFGALRAGAVPVPLDVRSAHDFVLKVVEATEPQLAIVSRASQQTAPGDLLSDLIIVALEDLDQRVAGYSSDPTDVDVKPDDLAEIMFTSGTTGDPKGVVLTHRNIVSNAQAVKGIFLGSSSDRLLSLLPLSHMLDQCAGLLVPFLSGARIVYPVSRQPALLFKAFRENQITLLLMVPQGLRLFISGIEREVERQAKGGDEAQDLLVENGIPVFRYPEDAARTLRLMVRRWRMLARRPGKLPTFNVRKSAAGRVLKAGARGDGWLMGAEAEAVLSAYGIPFAESRRVRTPAAAVAAAGVLGFPVVLKAEAPGLLHKSDHLAVSIDLHDEEDLFEAAADLVGRLRRRFKGMKLLVQRQAPGRLEVLLGMTRDERYGPLFVLGMGGIEVEALGDVALRIAPLDDRDPAEMIASLRGARLFEAFRGEPAVNSKAAQEGLMRLQHLVRDFPDIEEVEINPFILGSRGEPSLAVDARLRVRV